MERGELSDMKMRFLEGLKRAISSKCQRARITEFDCAPEFMHPDYDYKKGWGFDNWWRFERLAEGLEKEGYIVRRQNTSGLYVQIFGLMVQEKFILHQGGSLLS